MSEYPCPECHRGRYTIGDNDGWVAPGVFDDEGKPVDECPLCEAELTPQTLLLA